MVYQKHWAIGIISDTKYKLCQLTRFYFWISNCHKWFSTVISPYPKLTMFLIIIFLSVFHWDQFQSLILISLCFKWHPPCFGPNEPQWEVGKIYLGQELPLLFFLILSHSPSTKILLSTRCQFIPSLDFKLMQYLFSHRTDGEKKPKEWLCSGRTLRILLGIGIYLGGRVFPDPFK